LPLDEQAMNRPPTSDPATNAFQRLPPAAGCRLPAEDRLSCSSPDAPNDGQQGSPLAGEQDGNRPRTGAPATNESAVPITSDSVSPASPESRPRKPRAGRPTPLRA